MATTFQYFFPIRDHAAATPVRKTGLTPTWVFLNKATDNSVLSTALATISEVGNGVYKVVYDVETNGEAVGQIDCGSTLTNVDDRYIDMSLTAYGLVNLAQAVPNSSANPGNTVGSGLIGGDVAAFGKQAITGTSFFIYARDGTTILRTFTLNSASSPTSRQ